MRRSLLTMLALMPLAQAQDARERVPVLAQARRDLQAQLDVADMLLERGDVDAAALVYRRAIETFGAALGQGEAPAKPLPKFEPEDPALRAAEATRAPPVWGRRGRGEARNLRAGGGSGLTENAVNLGLEWLAKHQDEDGRWDSDGFMKHDPDHDRCDGKGHRDFDIGVTGLALLAFLGAGQTDDAGTYPDTVRSGLHFLLASQGENGRIAGPDLAGGAYEHAIATTVLCEAYGLTRSPRYRDAAARAVRALQRARNPSSAWRYERNGENDTSVTAWCTMALHVARSAGIEVEPAAIAAGREWVEKMTEPNWGQVGYTERGGNSARLDRNVKRFPVDRTQAMTAAGMLVRIVAGEDPLASEMVKKGADLCVYQPPKWNSDDGSIDMYYWYWGTLALFQKGGTHWRKWNEAMVDTIVKHQHQKGSGSRTGSWDPLCAWGEDGGRVYSTALLTMCLEVYYRYDRIFGVK